MATKGSNLTPIVYPSIPGTGYRIMFINPDDDNYIMDFASFQKVFGQGGSQFAVNKTTPSGIFHVGGGEEGEVAYIDPPLVLGGVVISTSLPRWNRTNVFSWLGTPTTTLFVVPTGYSFLLDEIHVVCTSVSGSGTPAVFSVQYNPGGSPETILEGELAPTQANKRIIYNTPMDLASAGVQFTVTITSASTFTTNAGFFAIKGQLIKL